MGSNNMILLGMHMLNAACHFVVFSDVVCLFAFAMFKIVSLLPELKEVCPEKEYCQDWPGLAGQHAFFNPIPF
jgi:hypothetical protein